MSKTPTNDEATDPTFCHSKKTSGEIGQALSFAFMTTLDDPTGIVRHVPPAPNYCIRTTSPTQDDTHSRARPLGSDTIPLLARTLGRQNPDLCNDLINVKKRLATISKNTAIGQVWCRYHWQDN